MGRIIICKHCGEEVGEFYSQLDEHLWAKHKDIMMKFMYKNAKYRSPISLQDSTRSKTE